MKNLFKKLMLVAVAAMAFTACSQDVNEVNKVEKKTVISGVLNIENEDTRSGFTGSYTEGDKTFYQSKWDGGESIKVYIDGYGSVFTTVDSEGRFEVAVDGEISSGTSMYVCSPADAWDSQWTPTIPTEQTPRANSVDPAAHILQSMGATVGSSMITMSPQQACYGKMTVNAPDFEIAKVEVSFNGGQVYTINAKDVENNVFWFAVGSMIDVSTFTVTAYDAENNAITKTVDVAAAGKTLKFQWGRVSTFSVSGLEVVEPEEPESIVFNQASVTGNSGDVYAYFYTANGDVLKLNPYNVFVDGTWPVGTHVIKASSGYVYPGLGQHYSTYNGVDVEGGEIVVSVKNKMYYIEFNNLVDSSGNILIKKAIFEGEITGLQVPDMRTKLAAPSNITSSVDGKTITLSWDAVEGANGYRVKLYSPYEEYFEEVVTTTEYVYEAQLYSKQYSFTIMSYANDENVTYKSSDDAYAYVTTGKDPSIWADVVANNIVWDSSNGAFKMTGEVVSGTAWGHSSDYIRLYINESDRPGNNSIKVGTYTGCGGTSPQAGQFGARLSLYWGNVTYPSDISSASTVEVSYDEAVGYTIVLTHNNVTYGYKGMPQGWVAPSAGGESGGDEPVNPEPDQPETGVADGTSIAKAYTFTSYSTYKDFGYPVMCLSGAENGATFNFESNSQVGFPTGMHKFNDGAWYPALCEYKINGEAQAVDFVNSVIWVEGNNVNGYTVEYIYIVTEGGNGIYYKYDGKFFM